MKQTYKCQTLNLLSPPNILTTKYWEKQMLLKTIVRRIILVALCGVTSQSFAGITLYNKDGKYVKVGGRIQIQFNQTDPSAGNSTDDVFFRRLRPYIEGSLHKDWKAKFQWDMGKASGSNEIAIKDAYFQYKGYKGMKVTLGNALVPFSRETLTSSKKQGFVERTFVGDHNYGSPDRALGLHLKGKSGQVNWGLSLASSSIDPSSSKIDFDTPVNESSDFNEGWIAAARAEYHIIGNVKLSQGDFSGKTGLSVAVAGFSWNNDDDNNGSANSLDNVSGLELSLAFRSSGFSVDVEFNKFEADAVNPALTSGLYVNGSTTLENWSVEAGYMFMPKKMELVLGVSGQDADGYADEWTRTTIGLNYYVKKHNIKYQLSYRQNENIDGVIGSDSDEVFLQAQFVF